MTPKGKRHQLLLLIILIVLSVGSILGSGISYVNLDSTKAALLLISGLIVCVLFLLLIQRTYSAIRAESQNAEYQTGLFQLFTSYLSSNTNDIYMMIDHETQNLEYVSPNIKQVLGINPENMSDVLHILSADIDPEPSAARTYNRRLQSMTPGRAVLTRNTERVNAETGEHRYFQENAYCAAIHGHIKYMFCFSDRTEEHKAQENLSEALQIAEMANNAKSTFLSSVSHDIRSPMNSIIGFLSLMRDEVDNPDAVLEYNKRIDAASQHLLGLINDVLDMNKIESGSATLNIIDFNLAEVIDEISTIVHPQAKAKNQTFDVLVTGLTYEHLLGDKLRINQILINLLSNSVKYTQEGGYIQLRIEELPQETSDYSHIRFTISDNGLGMSREYLQVIFEPYTREETRDTLQIQGTGLGMPITKSLVDLMGGKIQVESEPGQGSIFTIDLAFQIQERKEDSSFWRDHHITRILVTDDEEDICRYIVKTMSQIGVITDYATNGRTAMEMLHSAKEEGSPYSLILLDWKMPELGGLETARLIRKDYSDRIPIFLLTGYDWHEVEQEATECGVNSFLPKPFFVTTFKKAIHQLSTDRKSKTNDQLSGNIVQGKHILIVDDMKANQFILSKVLTTLGARCDIANNGQEAAKMFESALSDAYDLILMDVQMPVADGYTATRMIRSSNLPSAQTIPIIAMTANAFVEDIQDAHEAGMDAHVAKPFQRDKLLATIQEVLIKNET